MLKIWLEILLKILCFTKIVKPSFQVESFDNPDTHRQKIHSVPLINALSVNTLPADLLSKSCFH